MESEFRSPSSARPSAGVGRRLTIIAILGLAVLSAAGYWRWKSGGWPEDIKAKYKNYYHPPKGYDANQAAIKQTGDKKKSSAEAEESKASSDELKKSDPDSRSKTSSQTKSKAGEAKPAAGSNES